MIGIRKDKDKDFGIQTPFKNAEEALDAWLEAERLTLSNKEKERVIALVAQIFHDHPETSPAAIKNYLGNLAGGADVDLEDPTSVEIEVQRLLGHTEPVSSSSDRVLLKAGAALLVFNLLFMAFNMWFVTYKVFETQAAVTTDIVYLTPEQVADLDMLVREIAAEESALVGAPMTEEWVWETMYEVRGIPSRDQIPQAKFIQIKHHLMRWKSKLARYKENLN